VSCGSDGECWAVGSGYDTVVIMHRDTQQGWSIVPPVSAGGDPIDGELLAVACPAPAGCWAVGDDAQNGVLIVHEVSGSWSVVTGVSPGAPGGAELSAVACPDPDDCWAAGYTMDTAGNYVPLIEQDLGTGFAVVPVPDPGYSASLSGISCVGPRDCWAVGDYNTNGLLTGVMQYVLIEHDTGSGWVVVSSPTPGAGDAGLSGISCISASDCWAVGDYADGNLNQLTLVEHWDGTAWEVVSSATPGVGTNPDAPLPGGVTAALAAVACPPTGPCQAVGSVTGVGSSTAVTEQS
jgi:hypothetical protein